MGWLTSCGLAVCLLVACTRAVEDGSQAGSAAPTPEDAVGDDRGGATPSAGAGGAGLSTGGVSGSDDVDGAGPGGNAGIDPIGRDAGELPVSMTDAGTPPAVPIEPPVASGCITDVSPGVHDLECDMTVHTLSVPEQCTKTACGVIVDVHGGMMSSQMEDENTNLRALGVEHGYIVIQPNAQQNAALLDQRLFVPDAPMMPADDTRVMNILMQVIEVFHADRDRIHMTGFSEGGYMTWRWLCSHSDLLASVAPGASGFGCANLANLGLTAPEIGCEMKGSAVPAAHIPVLYLQGMMDGLVDPMCADEWVRSNVLSELTVGEGTVIDGDPTFASAQFVRTRYHDEGGVPFEYLQHQYTSDSEFLGVPLVGHCFPGSPDLTHTPPAETVIPPDQLMAFGCKGTTDFTWGEEVIAFFMAHPKR